MAIKDKVAEVLRSAADRLNSRGEEIPDPQPVSIPIEMRRPETSDERIRRIIAHSASMEARRQGFESFEDADDFDIEDDPIDPSTPYEQDFDHAIVAGIQHEVVTPPPALDPKRLKELKERYTPKGSIKKDPKKSAPPEPSGDGEDGPSN